MILALIGLLVPASAALGLAVAVVVGSQVRGLRFALVALAAAVLLLPHSLWRTVGLVVLVVIATVVLVTFTRFARSPAEVRRHYPIAIWARIRWRWLARNLNLARRDTHVQDKRRRSAVLPGVRHLPPVTNDPGRHKVRHLRARFRPASHGMTVTVRTIPGTGRKELEEAADHLANAWRCCRVGVSQPAPGRVVLRAIRKDPLTVPLSSAVIPPFRGRDVLLGRDELGDLRTVSLANISGSVIGGNPGRGKTNAAGAIAVQFAPAASTSWYVLDGKGGGDWSGWRHRAEAYAEDNLADATAVLELAHSRMVERLGKVRDQLGVRNAWAVGPTPDYPLLWVLIDECHQFLDLDSAKAFGREAEQHVRQCRALIGAMLRKGRSVLVHTTLIAQKATSTSIPPDIRDLAGLRLCFGVATTEAAVAVLGDDIRQYPTANPTGLQGEEHAGVATARLATGADVYTRLRVPDVEAVLDSAAATASKRLSETRPVCVRCVGEDSASCARCHGTAVDPDPFAPRLQLVKAGGPS